MCRIAGDLLDHDPGVTVWVAGSGAGTSSASRALLFNMLSHAAAPGAGHEQRPVVLDADTLNLLAQGRLALPAPSLTVLTFHPGEAGRLLGRPISQVQADRPAAVRALEVQYGAWAVLKGGHTLLADPDAREITFNPTDTAGLATAGRGDVLAGLLGSPTGPGSALAQGRQKLYFVRERSE